MRVVYSPRMDQATRDAFAKLTHTVERGFAAVAEDIASVRTELKADIASVRTELKAEIASVRTELKADIAVLGEHVASIEGDLRSFRRDLNDLADKVDNIAGFRKEIDHALDRIVAIEKHLGISRQIAA